MVILAAIEFDCRQTMKTVMTKSLIVLVVTVATVRSYVSLAMHTRVLPQHLA